MCNVSGGAYTLYSKIDSISNESLPSTKKGEIVVLCPYFPQCELLYQVILLLILSFSSLFLFWFIESPSGLHVSESSLKWFSFSMHKTLVIFDLDQNVIWLILYVSGMKSFCIFDLCLFQSKISKSFLKIWKCEILQDWFESFSFTQNFLSGSNWTKVKHNN